MTRSLARIALRESVQDLGLGDVRLTMVAHAERDSCQKRCTEEL